MLEMRCAACQGCARYDTTIRARAAAQDSPGNLGGYRSDYPAPLLGCMADIQRSEGCENVGGCEVRSRATGVGLRAAIGRASAGPYAGGKGLDGFLRRPPASRQQSTCNSQ